MIKQVIIVRKDLNMSPGKLAAQVAHASTMFLMNACNNGKTYTSPSNKINDKNDYCALSILLHKDSIEWMNEIYTKIICEAKSHDKLLKSIEIANNLGLKENQDYFLVKDMCLTELNPEEYDESGVGRTLTCIGFRPLPDNISNQISKKYQLLK